jgi:hypothetical protein
MAVVSYAHAVREKLREWVAVAIRLGLRDELAAAVREMDDRLQSDPESWGDPVRDFQQLRLTLYYRYGPLLTVDYTVHIDGTPVFVMGVHLRPGTALHDAAG